VTQVLSQEDTRHFLDKLEQKIDEIEGLMETKKEELWALGRGLQAAYDELREFKRSLHGPYMLRKVTTSRKKQVDGKWYPPIGKYEIIITYYSDGSKSEKHTGRIV